MAITGQIAPSARESTTQASRSGERLLGRIGNTPLLRLERLGREFSHVEFYAKAEWFNPGGSVKDRPALNMIQAGLASGALKCGKAIIDATSGNTGIAYAMIGAAMGYPVKLCLPDSASHERKRILAAYGAELVIHLLERFLDRKAGRCGDDACLADHLVGRIVAKASQGPNHCRLAYSALACLRIGMSGSASFQSVRKSW